MFPFSHFLFTDPPTPCSLALKSHWPRWWFRDESSFSPVLWPYACGHPPPWIKSTMLSQISLNNLFFSGNFYFNDSFGTCNISLWLICYYCYCCFIEDKPDLRQVRWVTQHQKNQVFGFPNRYSCFSPEAQMSCLSSLKNSWSRKCQCQGWVWGTVSMNAYSLPQCTAAVLSAKTGKCQPLLCNSRCISQEDRYPSSIEALKRTLGMVCWIFWARSPPGEIIRVIWKSFFKPNKSRDEGCVIRGATRFSKALQGSQCHQHISASLLLGQTGS